MNPIKTLIETVIQDGSLVIDGSAVFEGEVLFDNTEGASDALPKEMAIKYGFIPELNQNGARPHEFANQLIREYSASDDEIKRLTAPQIPSLFVIEDELNNPVKGTAERINLNKNRDTASFNAMIGGKFSHFAGLDGFIVSSTVYYLLGADEEAALQEFKMNLLAYVALLYQTTSDLQGGSLGLG